MATGALLVVVIGGFAIGHSSRNAAHTRPATQLAVATPGETMEAESPAAPRMERPPVVTPPPAHARARNRAKAAAVSPHRAKPAASAPAPSPGEARPAQAEVRKGYGVQVATFLSESRATAERDRLAAAIGMPCRIVTSDEDGYAIVVGPVAGPKEAVRLSEDLSRRGVVSEARVVRWARSSGKGR